MRKIIMLLTTFIMLFMLSVPAYAAGQPGEVYIEVSVDEGIKLSGSDIFVLSYGPDGSEETKTLEIAASELSGQVGSFSLPEGSYVIYDCAYGGDNTDIIEQGYVVTGAFEVGGAGVNQITLAIGSVTGMRLINEEADYMAFQNGEVVETLDPMPVNDDPDLYNGDGTGIKKVRPKNSETVSDDSTQDPAGDSDDYSQNELVERESNKKPSSGVLIKFLLLALVGVIGTVTLIVLKKKNKF